MIYRNIKSTDNPTIAKIIRESLDSYNLGIPGTVYTDPTTDNLYTLFQVPKASYIIIEDKGMILGGCGVYPTLGLPEGYVELVKLYLRSTSKGKGLGEELMKRCITIARQEGYTHIYLETINELSSAIKLYEKMGFKSLNSPIGNSGHNACDIWMIKSLL